MEFKFKKSLIALSLSVLVILLSIIVFNNNEKEYKLKIDNIAKQETNSIAMFTVESDGQETPINKMPLPVNMN